MSTQQNSRTLNGQSQHFLSAVAAAIWLLGCLALAPSTHAAPEKINKSMQGQFSDGYLKYVNSLSISYQDANANDSYTISCPGETAMIANQNGSIIEPCNNPEISGTVTLNPSNGKPTSIKLTKFEPGSVSMDRGIVYGVGQGESKQAQYKFFMIFNVLILMK